MPFMKFCAWRPVRYVFGHWRPLLLLFFKRLKTTGLRGSHFLVTFSVFIPPKITYTLAKRLSTQISDGQLHSIFKFVLNTSIHQYYILCEFNVNTPVLFTFSSFIEKPKATPWSQNSGQYAKPEGKRAEEEAEQSTCDDDPADLCHCTEGSTVHPTSCGPLHSNFQTTTHAFRTYPTQTLYPQPTYTLHTWSTCTLYPQPTHTLHTWSTYNLNPQPTYTPCFPFHPILNYNRPGEWGG